MNQYPTLFFSFKDVDGLTFSSAYDMLTMKLADLFRQHQYLLDSKAVDDGDKAAFTRIKNNHASPAEMMEVMRAMLGTALKDNPFLCFAVVTGCLRIAKESIFTGTNNIVVDTISDNRYNKYFSFTETEVQKILKDTDCEKNAEQIREWYDGYRFGNLEIYCPWDVLNYIHELQINPAAEPAGYWKNTSDNAIIRSFIDYAGSNITMKLEALMSGKSITQRIESNLTYDYLHSSEENLWSILYFTGYLTSMDEDHLHISLQKGEQALVIPNQEMTKLLRRTISYHDYREDFYHAFLTGIFTGAGYTVESNREHGEGRSDIVVFDPVEGRGAVFEAKYAA